MKYSKKYIANSRVTAKSILIKLLKLKMKINRF